MSYSGAVPAGPPVKTGGALDFYVAGDAVGASDNNAGTIAAPWKTINHAIDVINQFDEITASLTVHIAPATVNGYTWTSILGAHLLRANITFNADGAGQGGDAFTVLVGSTGAIAGSSTAQIVTAGGFGTNTYRGKTIQVLTGAAAGDLRTIRDHTDTTLIPGRLFSAAVANGDTFRVVEPATTITVNAAAGTSLINNCGPSGDIGNMPLAIIGGTGASSATAPVGVCLVNLRFAFTTAAPVSLHGSLVTFFGCDSVGANSFALSGLNATVFAGCQGGFDASAPLGLAFGAVSRTSWSGWGIYGKASIQLACSAIGCFVAGDGTGAGGLSFVGGASLFWFFGSSSVVNTTSALQGVVGQLPLRIEIGNTFAGNAVALANTAGTNAALDLVSGGNNFDGAQILLRKCVFSAPVLVRVTGPVGVMVDTAANVSGAGSTLGLDCRYGAQVYLNGVTGLLGPAGADISVDANATSITAATLSAAGVGLMNSANGACVRRFA